MDKKFYIDESGNTGDLVVTEKDDNFSSQEYFTLACVGLNDSSLPDLEGFIKELKSKYKIQSPELKFSKMKGIFGKKIGFILELLKYIEESCNILIEVVDKKYFLSTTIVNCLVNPPYFQPDRDQNTNRLIHLELSQWVYDHVTKEFLIKFTNISRNPSEEGLIELFDDLLSLARETKDPLSDAVCLGIEESIDDFNLLKRNNKQVDRDAYTYFLPLPDTNKRGQLIGVLPYISSFYNLHARLNHLFQRNLSEVSIIHDNQSHFDEILKYYHSGAVENTNEESVTFDTADFVFLNSSSLQFQDDKGSIGLQVADLFAGLLNRAIPHLIYEDKTLTDAENAVLQRVMASLYYQQAINFVLPKKQNEKLFPILDRIVNLNIGRSLAGVCIDKADDALLENLTNQVTRTA
ncbi:DUF3800 domain-containing protein [Shewanella algae]|uniref:DUF3800 domain-containing protein n=1 Tax=Shewanella algae TaxID=38313 RepID=UPI00101ED78D|nr:DUF3800 domain-containing protein [Shewanella algae]MBO2680361.1 DUF3800 domain-containing protein [Shewanella algae]